MKIISISLFLILIAGVTVAQEQLFKFGEEVGLEKITSGKKAKGESVQWIQVNTKDTTWEIQKDELICFGHPIGVIRSERKYENFLLHIEWKHMEAGGNSGTFVWSDANADDEKRLPNGVEVQMLAVSYTHLTLPTNREV